MPTQIPNIPICTTALMNSGTVCQQLQNGGYVEYNDSASAQAVAQEQAIENNALNNAINQQLADAQQGLPVTNVNITSTTPSTNTLAAQTLAQQNGYDGGTLNLTNPISAADWAHVPVDLFVAAPSSDQNSIYEANDLYFGGVDSTGPNGEICDANNLCLYKKLLDVNTNQYVYKYLSDVTQSDNLYAEYENAFLDASGNLEFITNIGSSSGNLSNAGISTAILKLMVINFLGISMHDYVFMTSSQVLEVVIEKIGLLFVLCYVIPEIMIYKKTGRW